MDERDRLVIRYAHLGSGRNPRNRHITEEQRRLAEEYIAEIQASRSARTPSCPT